MLLSLSHALLILISFQSLTFSYVLISASKQKLKANTYLSLFLIAIALQMFGIIAGELSWWNDFFLRIACTYGFLYGPLLYLYTQFIIFRDKIISMKSLLHFIPAGLNFLIGLIGFEPCSISGILMYISLIAYVTLSIKAILSYRSIVQKTNSVTDKIDLQWLVWTMLLFIVTLLADIVDQFMYSLHVNGISMVHLSLLFLVNSMFVKGLKQPTIFLGISENDKQLAEIETPATKDTLSTEEQTQLTEVRNYLNSTKKFTNPELSLNQLAYAMNLPARHLSRLINRAENQTFVSFINTFRIELAKERLRNPQDNNETIQEVMFDVGFNSKSSFNTVFKQLTGKTPSEYKKKLK